MKKITFAIVPLVAGLFSSGCISTHRTEVLTPTGRTIVEAQPGTTTTTQTVVVSPGPPPAPLTDNVTTPPTETDVWVGGYWDFVNNKWVWLPGHWEARPRAGAIWVPGHWDQSTKGNWVWTPGYWE